MSRMESKLLPCPFCGGEAMLFNDKRRGGTVWHVWHVCDGPTGYPHGYGIAETTSVETPWFDTEGDAIAAWNARAAVTPEQFACAVHDGHLWARMDEDEQEREIARLEAFIAELMACPVPPRFSAQMRDKAGALGIEVAE